MPTNDYEPVTKRLDAILRLILELQRERDKSITIGDQILLLEDSGISPTESGTILGVKSNQIPSYVRSAKNQNLRKRLQARSKRAKTPES